MTGKVEKPTPADAVRPPMKRPVVMAAVVVMVASAAGVAAWLTRASGQPPPAAPPANMAQTARPAAKPPSGDATPIVIPETPPPPPPTSADITAAGPPAPTTPTNTATAPEPTKPADWEALPISDLRARAEGNQVPAMEELARRLIQGIGVAKDEQAGAGWLLRAAQAGSSQAAFNVGVMYERGFVVDRDSTRAIEWYRKAVKADLPAAKHNLALLLRDGKGAPRNGKEAVELLRSAAQKGMAASMFTLGDIYERGDAAPKDQVMALAWFSIAAEFERQTNHGTDTPLGKTATQRAQTLQRILTPAELERAQQLGQREFDQIVDALQPANPSAQTPSAQAAAPRSSADLPGWGKTASDQVRAIQQILFDMGFLREKPDGALGPMTRTAIRAFQKSASLRETGEPTRDVYMALRNAALRDVVTNSPLPMPSKVEPSKAEADTAEKSAPPPGQDKLEAPYPTALVDQVKAVQSLLRALNFYRDDADGALGPATRNAIRAFQKSIGMRETGEPTKDVYAALQEAVQKARATRTTGQPN
jgi:TPR repeat protein